MDEEEKKALRALANSPEIEAMFNAVMSGCRVENMLVSNPKKGIYTSERATA